MTYRRKIKSTVSIALILTMIFSILSISCISTSAKTYGGESKSAVLQVWTNKKGSTPSITLSQTPAKYKYTNWFGNTKTKNIYKNYYVTVKPVCTVDGGKTKLKSFSRWLDSSSEKINLQKGIYYEITVKLTAVPVKLPSTNGNYISRSSWELTKVKNCSNYK